MTEVAKIDFEDGSFILFEAREDESKINVVMCGRKDFNSVTMSASSIDMDQAKIIQEFLQKWITQ